MNTRSTPRGRRIAARRRGEAVQIPAKTAERDLAELRERGLTAFEARPAPGHYRLVCPQDQAD